MHMENYHLAKRSATTTSLHLPAPTQHPSGQGLPAITFKRSCQRCAFSKTMGDSFDSLICFQHYSAVCFFIMLVMITLYLFSSSEGISFSGSNFGIILIVTSIYQKGFLIISTSKINALLNIFSGTPVTTCFLLPEK